MAPSIVYKKKLLECPLNTYKLDYNLKHVHNDTFSDFFINKTVAAKLISNWCWVDTKYVYNGPRSMVLTGYKLKLRKKKW